MNEWNAEYARSGMPSSFRDDPSGVVVWTLENWPHLTGLDGLPKRGLDVGCGTARNTVYLARHGVRMSGFDTSDVAIDAGRRRVRQAGVDVDLQVHDLSSGLPFAAGEMDLVLDVFVYKHQLWPEVRKRYRQELLRVLSTTGRVLISLAEPTDGYYATCPPSNEANASPHAIVDPEVGVGSVLFSLEELTAEMADEFDLEMAWRKEKMGLMHGSHYIRHTLATIWRPRQSEQPPA